MVSEYREVRQLFSELGFRPHLRGYRYLVETIIVASEVGVDFMITKDVYPVVAGRLNTNPIRVERSCRYVIDKTYENYKQLWLNLLNIEDRPTASEFIWYILMYFEEYHMENNA